VGGEGEDEAGAEARLQEDRRGLGGGHRRRGHEFPLRGLESPLPWSAEAAEKTPPLAKPGSLFAGVLLQAKPPSV
jgi:hypothetical protein